MTRPFRICAGKKAGGSVLSFRQTEDVERALRGHGDILVVVHRERDRATGDRSTQIHLPQQLSAARIERKEVSLAASREEQVRGRGQHAALRVIDHLEVPLLFAGLRVNRADGAVALGFCTKLNARAASSSAACGGRRSSGVFLAFAPWWDLGQSG